MKRLELSYWPSEANRRDEGPRERVLVRNIEERGIRNGLEILLAAGKQGFVREIDLADGCGWLAKMGLPELGSPCETCLVDAPLISRMFDLGAIVQLFGKYLDLFDKRRIKLGIGANPLDHPKADAIVESMLGNCLPTGRKVEMWLRYQPGREDQVDNLLELARRSGGMFRLVISLPLNSGTGVNEMFDRYVVEGHPGLAVRGSGEGRGNYANVRFEDYPGLMIADIPHHSFDLARTGRGLSQGDLIGSGRMRGAVLVNGDELFCYHDRAGAGVGYINPDGIWLRVLLTSRESPTAQGFYRIETREDLEMLEERFGLYHDSEYSNSVDWRGGYMRRRTEEGALERRQRLIDAGLEIRDLRVVGGE